MGPACRGAQHDQRPRGFADHFGGADQSFRMGYRDFNWVRLDQRNGRALFSCDVLRQFQMHWTWSFLLGDSERLAYG
jgi:hypothetical protein